MIVFLTRFLRLIFRNQPHSQKGYVTDMLLYALDQNYNYLIFECSDDKKFIQFATDSHRLWMDIPTTSYNYLFPYMKESRKLLERLDFNLVDGKSVGYKEYKYNDSKGVCSLNANFGINAELAADFVIKVFKDIYKEDLSELKIKFSE